MPIKKLASRKYIPIKIRIKTNGLLWFGIGRILIKTHKVVNPKPTSKAWHKKVYNHLVTEILKTRTWKNKYETETKKSLTQGQAFNYFRLKQKLGFRQEYFCHHTTGASATQSFNDMQVTA